ncbi:MAG: trigger factor [Lachnospiraceae bacterium]|nr:trigger factor [Lachnospiraceae bacterium]
MKKLSLLMGAVCASAILMTGCGDQSLANVKASKYVTLGEYKGLTVSVNDTVVTDEDVQEEIDSELEAKATLEPVTGRAVVSGDTVNIDYVGKKDGVAFQGGTAEGYNLSIGSHSFIDGFEDGLIGHEAGEKVLLNLTFPENYSTEELAGQAVTFDVTINSISENVVPTLTDEVAKEINSEVSTVDEYRAAVRKDLEDTKQRTAKTMVYSDLLQTAIDNAEIVSGNKLPKWLVKENADSEKSSFESNLSAYGMTLDSYLSNVGMTEDEFNEQITLYAETIAKQQLLVRAIAQQENIEITSDDISEAYQRYADQYGYDSADSFKEAIKNRSGESTFEEAVFTEKVEEFLFKNANITNPEMVGWTVE